MNLKKIVIALSAAAAFAGSSSRKNKENNKPSNNSSIDMEGAKKCFEARHLYEVALNEEEHKVSDNVKTRKVEKDQACTGHNKANHHEYLKQNEKEARQFKENNPDASQRIEKCWVNGSLAASAWELSKQYLMPSMTAKLQEALSSLSECKEMFKAGSKWRAAYVKETKDPAFQTRFNSKLNEKREKQRTDFAQSLTKEEQAHFKEYYTDLCKRRAVGNKREVTAYDIEASGTCFGNQNLWENENLSTKFRELTAGLFRSTSTFVPAGGASKIHIQAIEDVKNRSDEEMKKEMQTIFDTEFEAVAP